MYLSMAKIGAIPRFSGCRTSSIVQLTIFLYLLQCGWCLRRPRVVLHELTLESGPLFQGDTLVSENEYFEAGLFALDGCSRNYYFGIRFRAPIVAHVTWLANRDAPLSNKAYWMLSAGGSLQLYDESIGQPNKPLWTSTDASGVNSVVARLNNTGNLLLLDKSNSSTWDSFRAPPTDTLLPGQFLYQNASATSKLTSWKGTRDPGSGYYTFGWDNDANGTLQLQLAWRAPINSSNFSGGVYLPEPLLDVNPPQRPDSHKRTDFGNVTSLEFTAEYGLIEDSWAIERESFLRNPGYVVNSTHKQLQQLQMGKDGMLRIWTWDVGVSKAWSSSYESNLLVIKRKANDCNACCTYGVCGPYGLCKYIESEDRVECACPELFTANDPEDSTKGCSPIVPLHPPRCTNLSEVRFLTLKDTDYPWGGDTGDMIGTANASFCQELCRSSCSCAAAVHSEQETRDDGQKGKCWLKVGPLWNGGWRTVTKGSIDRTAYVKVSIKQPDEAPGPSPLISKGWKIALSVAGSILGLGLLVGLIVLCIKRCPRMPPAPPELPRDPFGPYTGGSDSGSVSH